MNTKKILSLAFVLLLLASCMVIGLVSCHSEPNQTSDNNKDCQHQWVDATCTAPKTCSLCSLTEGEALGHNGGNATCTQKAVCSVCSAEYGDLIPHAYTEEIAGEETLKSVATCESTAIYYKSCSCGVISNAETDVFSVGSTKRHQFEGNICTSCGFEEKTFLYLNLLNSYCTTDRLSIETHGPLSIECKTTGKIPNGTFLSFKRVGITELEIYIEDGKLGGAARGEFEIDYHNAPDVSIEFYAIISDGYIYISEEYSDTKFKISLEELLEKYLGSAEMPDTTVNPEDISFITEMLPSMLESLPQGNKAAQNELLGRVINMFFTTKKMADGSLLQLQLSQEKFLALNEALATKSVAEVVDLYLGPDTFDTIVDSVFEILDLKLCDIPAYLNDNGIDYDAFLLLAENLLPTLGASENLDLNGMLTSSELSNHTIGMVLFQTEDLSYQTMIYETVVDVLCKTPFYELIPAPEGTSDQVTTVINQVFDYADFGIGTDANGNLRSAFIEILEMPVSAYSDDNYSSVTYLDATVFFYADGEINVTWEYIMNEINYADHPISEEMKNELTVQYISKERKFPTTIYFGDQTYDCTHIDVSVYESNFDSAKLASITSYQKDWLYYCLELQQTRYEFRIYVSENDGEQILFLYDFGTRKYAKVEKTGTGYNVTYEDGSQKYMILAEQENLVSTMSQLVLLVFPDITIDTIWGGVSYSYNVNTGEYSTKTPYQ